MNLNLAPDAIFSVIIIIFLLLLAYRAVKFILSLITAAIALAYLYFFGFPTLMAFFGQIPRESVTSILDFVRNLNI